MMTRLTDPTESQGSARDDGDPFRLDYLAHGLRIRVEGGSPDVIDMARQELPPGEFELARDDMDVDRSYRIIASDEAPTGFYLYTNDERSGHFHSLATTVERLESSIQI